ncbi:nuclear transport factor 2 family protein [Dactylosporangium sp. NPDC000244]|uniref:nuclear transport factor 2 family protein n=1 Tax=Dactylosporangium sp. NPDC000244 TaxID=3154365 RepID=UPI00332B4A56
MSLQDLLDKQEISEILTRYMRAVDRGDLDALRACYLPGAVEEHGGVYTGPADAYVDSIERTLTHPRSITTHVISNVLIELDGDRAEVECYVTAFARVKPGDTLTVARMLDVFERVGGRWGIRHRRLVWEWNHDMDRTEGWIFGMLVPDPAVLHRGAKFPNDPVYAS